MLYIRLSQLEVRLSCFSNDIKSRAAGNFFRDTPSLSGRLATYSTPSPNTTPSLRKFGFLLSSSLSTFMLSCYCPAALCEYQDNPTSLLRWPTTVLEALDTPSDITLEHFSPSIFNSAFTLPSPTNSSRCSSFSNMKQSTAWNIEWSVSSQGNP